MKMNKKNLFDYYYILSYHVNKIIYIFRILGTIKIRRSEIDTFLLFKIPNTPNRIICKISRKNKIEFRNISKLLSDFRFIVTLSFIFSTTSSIENKQKAAELIQEKNKLQEDYQYLYTVGRLPFLCFVEE